MKFILAVYAVYHVYVVYGEKVKAPEFISVNNTCTNLPSAAQLSDIVGTYNIYYVNVNDIKCTKFFLTKEDNIYYAYYRPLPERLQAMYGVKGIEVEDPNNPGTMERFLNNTDKPVAVRKIVAYQANIGFSICTCEFKDSSPIYLIGIYAFENVTANMTNELKMKVETTMPNFKLKPVSRDCE